MNKVQIKLTILDYEYEENTYNLILTKEQMKLLDWLDQIGAFNCDYELNNAEIVDLTGD